MSGTKKKMEAQLPPTLCTNEMRDGMVAIASEKGKSIGEIQREAFSLFLSKYDSKTFTDDTTHFTPAT